MAAGIHRVSDDVMDLRGHTTGPKSWPHGVPHEVHSASKKRRWVARWHWVAWRILWRAGSLLAAGGTCQHTGDTTTPREQLHWRHAHGGEGRHHTVPAVRLPQALCFTPSDLRICQNTPLGEHTRPTPPHPGVTTASTSASAARSQPARLTQGNQALPPARQPARTPPAALEGFNAHMYLGQPSHAPRRTLGRRQESPSPTPRPRRAWRALSGERAVLLTADHPRRPKLFSTSPRAGGRGRLGERLTACTDPSAPGSSSRPPANAGGPIGCGRAGHQWPGFAGVRASLWRRTPWVRARLGQQLTTPAGLAESVLHELVLGGGTGEGLVQFGPRAIVAQQGVAPVEGVLGGDPLLLPEEGHGGVGGGLVLPQHAFRLQLDLWVLAAAAEFWAQGVARFAAGCCRPDETVLTAGFRLVHWQGLSSWRAASKSLELCALFVLLLLPVYLVHPWLVRV